MERREEGQQEGGGFIEYQMTRFGRHNKGSLPGAAASPRGTDPIIASLYLMFGLTLPSESKAVRHAIQSDIVMKRKFDGYSICRPLSPSHVTLLL